MDNQKDNFMIQCNIHRDCFTDMYLIKQQINHGSTIAIKAKHAEELLNKVVYLIDCPQYDDQKQDCKYCRMIAALHKKTADLIIKAKSLSQ